MHWILCRVCTEFGVAPAVGLRVSGRLFTRGGYNLTTFLPTGPGLASLHRISMAPLGKALSLQLVESSSSGLPKHVYRGVVDADWVVGS